MKLQVYISIKMMNFNNINHLKESGFVGFYSYNHLVSDYSLINPFKGVYLVINSNYKNPEFTDPGVCGTHKGKNPNRTIEHLKEKYVYGSQIMYIGKGGKLAKDSKANLQTRLKDYLKCSLNNTCSHFGGRNIWQLQKILCFSNSLISSSTICICCISISL